MSGLPAIRNMRLKMEKSRPLANFICQQTLAAEGDRAVNHWSNRALYNCRTGRVQGIL